MFLHHTFWNLVFNNQENPFQYVTHPFPYRGDLVNTPFTLNNIQSERHQWPSRVSIVNITPSDCMQDHLSKYARMEVNTYRDKTLLYHATESRFAENIIKNKIIVSQGRAHLDFNDIGSGFYLGTSINLAYAWMRNKTQRDRQIGAIMIFELDMESFMEDYDGKIFGEDEEDDWREVVKYYRWDSKARMVERPQCLDEVNESEQNIDYLMGPMATLFKEQSRTFRKLNGGNQLCIKSQKMADHFLFLKRVIFTDFD